MYGRLECHPTTKVIKTAPSFIDASLCNALVNMVGVILGTPRKASHLWYLLFAPKEVTGSYIPGFMVS